MFKEKSKKKIIKKISLLVFTSIVIAMIFSITGITDSIEKAGNEFWILIYYAIEEKKNQSIQDVASITDEITLILRDENGNMKYHSDIGYLSESDNIP